jgi:putative FmdB family regulatory protein
MPIYEYRCSTCHRIFEEWSRQVEENSSARSCPLCGREAKRLISHTSFSLKGEGWYVTDYGALKGKSESDAGVSAPPPPAPPAPQETAPLSTPPARTSSENMNAAAS